MRQVQDLNVLIVTATENAGGPRDSQSGSDSFMRRILDLRALISDLEKEFMCQYLGVSTVFPV